MENEYYTPELESFHIGFEYEFHGMTTGGLVIMDMKEGTVEEVSKPTHKVWSKETLTLDFLDNGYRSLSDIQRLIESDQIRVKYLDQEDIEELGFTYQGSDMMGGKHFEKRVEKYINHDTILRLIQIQGRVQIVTQHEGGPDDNGYTVFNGLIKNKSELKRILKIV